ncbi:MAG: class I SAM-dependent methyltransferase [Solirubrobacterales bacterium]
MGGRDTELPEMHPTRCAICEREDDAAERWPATFDPEAFSARVFSARRPPDRVHYRMVTCNTCGLVRSDPVAGEELLAMLYASSSFDYGGEVESIQATYGRALGWLEACSPRREALLEIGCGNGFFLQHARRRGWRVVRGVEPSADAVAKAPSELDGAIVRDVMHGGLFAPESFDAVCLFQVLDHIPDPVELLAECRAVLRPGGQILALNHNVSGWSARVLGERSPIVDIEHTYLYSPATMRAIFAKTGFTDARVRSVRNTYSLAYLAQLVPLPAELKSRLLPALRAGAAGRVRMTVPLGNLCLIARKPG